MAVTDAEYQAWLSDQKQRVILVEAESSNGTYYIGNTPYISEPPGNQPYIDVVTSIPSIRSRIDGANEVGEIKVVNADGEFDDWLTYGWAGWPLRVYLGDPDWARSDFRLILDGVNDGLKVSNQNELALTWRDRGRLLEDPLQKNLDADNRPLPIALGTCFNVPPLVEDAGNLIYRVHQDGNLTSVDDVRDRGISVAFTDNGDGTFTLTNNPDGKVTADVTGETTGTPQDIAEWIAAEAGETDYDFSGLPSYSCGLYLQDDRSARKAIDEVVKSAGAVARWTRLGKMVAYQLDVPGTSSATFSPDDIQERGMSVARMEPPKTRIRLGYEKNFATQDEGSVAASVSVANKDRYSREYREVKSDNNVSATYPAAKEDELRGTLITNTTDAQSEADRRASLRSTQRIVYSFSAYAAPFQVGIGDTINVEYPAYGFDSGKDAVVVGLTERPTDNRVDIEVWA